MRPVAAEETGRPQRPLTPLALNLRRFARDRISLASAAIVLAMALAALFAPWIAPHDPYDSDLLRRLQPPAWMPGGEWRLSARVRRARP